MYEIEYGVDGEDHSLEIHAPHIRHLELLGLCYDKIHFQLRNVASLSQCNPFFKISLFGRVYKNNAK